MEPTLDDLVDALDRTVPPGLVPSWVEIHDTAHPGTAMFVRHDDLGELFGWVAPPECRALGVVAGGWGRPLVPAPGDSGDPPGADIYGDGPHLEAATAEVGPGQRVRVVVVVGADGAIAARTQFTDGATRPGGCQGGRLVDALRRGLDLPTAPPPTTSAPLLRDLWLGAIIDRPGGPGTLLGWTEATRLHPAVRMLAEEGHRFTQAETEALIRVTPRVWTWECLHAETADGAGLCALVAPELAAWMDTGMFARWALEEHRRRGDLWGEAAAALRPEAVVRLAGLLDATAEATGAVSRGVPAGY